MKRTWILTIVAVVITALVAVTVMADSPYHINRWTLGASSGGTATSTSFSMAGSTAQASTGLAANPSRYNTGGIWTPHYIHPYPVVTEIPSAGNPSAPPEVTNPSVPMTGLASVPAGQQYFPTTLGLPDIAAPSLPAVPSFSLPAVPDLTLPAAPEFSLPAVPDLNLPAVPAFSLPAVPELNLPAVPALSLPAAPEFTLPSFPTTLNLPSQPAVPQMSFPASMNLPSQPAVPYITWIITAVMQVPSVPTMTFPVVVTPTLPDVSAMVFPTHTLLPTVTNIFTTVDYFTGDVTGTAESVLTETQEIVDDWNTDLVSETLTIADVLASAVDFDIDPGGEGDVADIVVAGLTTDDIASDLVDGMDTIFIYARSVVDIEVIGPITTSILAGIIWVFVVYAVTTIVKTVALAPRLLVRIWELITDIT